VCVFVCIQRKTHDLGFFYFEIFFSKNKLLSEAMRRSELKRLRYEFGERKEDYVEKMLEKREQKFHLKNTFHKRVNS